MELKISLILIMLIINCILYESHKKNSKKSEITTPLVLIHGSGVGGAYMWEQVNQMMPNKFNHLGKTTTRQVREGIESPYNPKFASNKQFEQMIKDNQMLSYTVQYGFYYGVSNESWNTCIEASKITKNVICYAMMSQELARQIYEQGIKANFMAITVPSAEILTNRMIARGGEGIDAIKGRVAESMVQDKEIKASKWISKYINNGDGLISRPALVEYISDLYNIKPEYKQYKPLVLVNDQKESYKDYFKALNLNQKKNIMFVAKTVTKPSNSLFNQIVVNQSVFNTFIKDPLQLMTYNNKSNIQVGIANTDWQACTSLYNKLCIVEMTYSEAESIAQQGMSLIGNFLGIYNSNYNKDKSWLSETWLNTYFDFSDKQSKSSYQKFENEVVKLTKLEHDYQFRQSQIITYNENTADKIISIKKQLENTYPNKYKLLYIQTTSNGTYPNQLAPNFVSVKEFNIMISDNQFTVTSFEYDGSFYGLEKDEYKKCNNYQGLTCIGFMPVNLSNKFKNIIKSENTVFLELDQINKLMQEFESPYFSNQDMLSKFDPLRTNLGEIMEQSSNKELYDSIANKDILFIVTVIILVLLSIFGQLYFFKYDKKSNNADLGRFEKNYVSGTELSEMSSNLI